MRREEQIKKGRKRGAGKGEMRKSTGRRKGRGKELQMPEGALDQWIRFSGAIPLPLRGGVRGEEKGGGSLTECRCRALCFEGEGGSGSAFLRDCDCHNHINYLLSFQGLRLCAQCFKCVI